MCDTLPHGKPCNPTHTLNIPRSKLTINNITTLYIFHINLKILSIHLHAITKTYNKSILKVPNQYAILKPSQISYYIIKHSPCQKHITYNIIYIPSNSISAKFINSQTKLDHLGLKHTTTFIHAKTHHNTKPTCLNKSKHYNYHLAHMPHIPSKHYHSHTIS